MQIVEESLFEEIADFLTSQPTLEMLAVYKVSPDVQAHIDILLEKNRNAGLTPDERQAIEKTLTLLDMLNLVKAKAKLKLLTAQYA
ncbi:MAG: hypothetical protein SGJ24_08180 [Chloroflexota bacterium]|nr:hypothetical protein [Chloroflexota bacterium]